MSIERRDQRFGTVRDRSASGWLRPSVAILVRLATEHPRAVALFPLAFVLLMGIGKLLAPTAYGFLIAEDNVVEFATFLAYLVACAFAASLAMALHQRREKFFGVLYWVLSVGLFFIAMEEISWGQRIIGIDSPELLEGINYQSEMNFHNIQGFPLHVLYVLVSAYGAFARLLVPGGIGRRYPLLVDLLTLPRLTFLYFFIPFLLYSYYEYLDYFYRSPLGLKWSDVFTEASFVTGHDQEPIELLLSFGFLLFVVGNWHRHRHG